MGFEEKERDDSRYAFNLYGAEYIDLKRHLLITVSISLHSSFVFS